MMVAGNPGFFETAKLVCIQKAHRSAQLYIALLAHGFVSLNSSIKFLARQGSASCYNGKTMYTFIFIHAGSSQNFLCAKHGMRLTFCMIVGRLGTELAVLWTFATAAINNRAQVHMVTNTGSPDFVCSLTQFIQITGKEGLQIILSGKTAASNNFLS